MDLVDIEYVSHSAKRIGTSRKLTLNLGGHRHYGHLPKEEEVRIYSKKAGFSEFETLSYSPSRNNRRNIYILTK